jgi:hypothetical protein
MVIQDGMPDADQVQLDPVAIASVLDVPAAVTESVAGVTVNEHTPA